MTQKKFFQIAVISVVCVWTFCITFAITFTLRNRSLNKAAASQQVIVTNAPITSPPTTIPAVQTTTATPVTQATSPLVDVTSSGDSTVTTSTTTEAPSQSASYPKEKADIVNSYINGVNLLKNTPNFSMQKNDTLDVKITDVQIAGGDTFKNAVMNIANDIIKPPPAESYTFAGGVDAATNETPNSTIAPLNTAAKVDLNAVTDAKSQPNADGGYTVQITLQSESQSLNYAAPNLSTMVEVIDVSSLLPSGATLTDVNINYAPSIITAVFDSQNRITSMNHTLTSQGSGTGKMVGISATMIMEGTYSSNYTITYN